MTYTQEQLEKVKGFDAIELKQQFQDRISEIQKTLQNEIMPINGCLLYTSPSPRD